MVKFTEWFEDELLKLNNKEREMFLKRRKEFIKKYRNKIRVDRFLIVKKSITYKNAILP